MLVRLVISLGLLLTLLPNFAQAQFFPSGDTTTVEQPKQENGILVVETPLLGTDVGLSDITVFAKKSEATKELEKTKFYYNTRNEFIGAYSIQTLEPGTWQVWVDSPGYKKTEPQQVTVSHDSQEMLVIPIYLEPENILSGQITDESGMPFMGAVVTVGTDNDKKIAITNKEGKYEVEDYFLANKPYIVTAQSDSNTNQLGVVRFQKPAGQGATQNGKIAKAVSTVPVKIKMEALKARNGFIVAPTKRIAIKFFDIKDMKSNLYTAIKPSKGSSGLYELNIKPGCYEVLPIPEEEGYNLDSKIFCTEHTSYVLFPIVSMSDDPGYCTRAPRNYVLPFVNYWLCGEVAQSMLKTPLLQSGLRSIAASALLSREYYSKDKATKQLSHNLPAKIQIESTREEQASYTYKHDIPCEKQSDTILVTTGIIEKLDFKLLGEVYYHEFTHGLDHHYDNCKTFISEKDNRFIEAYLTLKLKEHSSGKSYITLLNESNYNTPKEGGHSEDSPHEAYASANVIKRWYKEPFTKKVKNLPPDVRKLLEILVQDAGSMPKSLQSFEDIPREKTKGPYSLPPSLTDIVEKMIQK